MRPETFRNLWRAAEAERRIRTIINDERLAMPKVAVAMGIPEKALVRILNGSVTAGPERITRMEQWLAQWDAAAVDLDALRIPRRPPESRHDVIRDRTRTYRKSIGCTWHQLAKLLDMPSGSLRGWLSGSGLSQERVDRIEAFLDSTMGSRSGPSHPMPSP
jgi:transcriptional regulator with XRE-family HTH domain